MHPSKRISGQRFLHSPGPTRVPEDVLNEMSRQPMDMGDPRLATMVAACEDGLRQVFQTRDADVFMYAANGHGAWEATIVNLIAPGQTVMVPGSGHFSETWAQHAEAFGAIVVRTPYRDGYPVDVAAIEAALREDTAHVITAVLVVHTDTASGMTSDIPAVRAAIDRAGHPALLVVDVVASLGASPFDMDGWGVNVALGASQKALMVPPGLSFMAVDARAMAVATANPTPRVYWDWGRRKSDFMYRKFCGTPPQNLLMGLEAALALILEEGLDVVLARHDRTARAVRAAVQAWSTAGALRFFGEVPEARSASVTTVAVDPAAFDPEALRDATRERFQVAVAGGLGSLAGRAFRIGHLGDINPAMILGCLGAIEAGMTAQGVPFGQGGIAAAIAVLSEIDA